MPQKGLPAGVVWDTTLGMSTHITLKKWLEANQVRAADMARACEYDPSNFSKVLRGKVTPGLQLAVRIEAETKGAVPAAAWVQAA